MVVDSEVANVYTKDIGNPVQFRNGPATVSLA